MTGAIATGATAAWSTAAVGPDQAFDYWCDLICDAFVQLSARPRHDGEFRGAITHHRLAGLELSVVTADSQRVDRTRRLIARSHEDYLLASVQLDGTGRVGQDERVAELRPGSLAFYDSTRPYTLDFDGPFRQLVVQVPKSGLARGVAGDATAVALDATGPGRVVVDFLRGLAREYGEGRPAPGLVPHAIGLLEFALGLAGASSAPAHGAATREAIRRAIADAAGDPDLRADDVAAACHISRRTLYRARRGRPLVARPPPGGTRRAGHDAAALGAPPAGRRRRGAQRVRRRGTAAPRLPRGGRHQPRRLPRTARAVSRPGTCRQSRRPPAGHAVVHRDDEVATSRRSPGGFP